MRAMLPGALWLALALAAPAAAQSPARAHRIEDLAWMRGSWQTAPGPSRTEEHWSAAAGGTLIGMGRTVAGDKTVFFEYLRVEARGGEIFYVAHPKAQSPGTDFRLVRLVGREAVFENPEHDFPKRIIYRANADGSLTARVEGDGGEAEKAEEVRYTRMPAP